jgi:hypothetical protein
MAFREAAESAIERAQEAAAEATGAKLRQGLEDVLSALGDVIPMSPDGKTADRLRRAEATVRQALADYDQGKLAELGALLVRARADILRYDIPGTDRPIGS